VCTPQMIRLGAPRVSRCPVPAPCVWRFARGQSASQRHILHSAAKVRFKSVTSHLISRCVFFDAMTQQPGKLMLCTLAATEAGAASLPRPATGTPLLPAIRADGAAPGETAAFAEQPDPVLGG